MFEKLMDSYKTLIIIPFIIALLSLSFVTIHGFDYGIDLKGGSQADLVLQDSVTGGDIENLLKTNLHATEVKILNSNNKEITIETDTSSNATAFTDALKGKAKVSTFNTIGPILSEEAMGQIYLALAFAFIFMAATVFIVFREPVPSIGVILAALFDIIIAIGGMSLFKIPLSIASVGALLMLIGYSVDTDILLTTRLLKRKEGTVIERAKAAMKTGLTMSLAAIVAMLILYLSTVIFMPKATTLSNISAVLIIGLCGDIITTWLMNLGILRWYIEKRQARKLEKFSISEETKEVKETNKDNTKKSKKRSKKKTSNKRPKGKKRKNKNKNKKGGN